MKTKKLLLVVAAVLFSAALFAQPKNVVKLNLPSLGYTAFNVQYERAVAGPLSFQLGINWRPKGKLPMSDKFITTDTVELLNNLKLSWFSMTPELRLYTSEKGAPKRFYFILPYVRYSKASLSSAFNLTLPDINTGIDQTAPVNLKGSLKVLGAGIGLGYQWIIKDMISVDMNVGAGYYFSKSVSASVASDHPTWALIIDNASADLDEQLADLSKDIKFKKDGNEISASTKLSVPIPSLRFGFTIGYAF